MEHEVKFPVRIRVQKAAALAGLSRKTLYRAARGGRIECYRIGNRFEFTEDGIARFLQASQVHVAKETVHV